MLINIIKTKTTESEQEQLYLQIVRELRAIKLAVGRINEGVDCDTLPLTLRSGIQLEDVRKPTPSKMTKKEPAPIYARVWFVTMISFVCSCFFTRLFSCICSCVVELRVQLRLQLRLRLCLQLHLQLDLQPHPFVRIHMRRLLRLLLPRPLRLGCVCSCTFRCNFNAVFGCVFTCLLSRHGCLCYCG